MLPSLITGDSFDACYFDNEPTGLAEIYQPSVNLAIWQRQSNSNVSHYAQWLINNTAISGIRSVVPLHKVKNEILSQLPVHTGQVAFADDVYLLAEMYADLFNLESIGIRLTILDKTMCPRFHVDKLPCRLVSTYIGSGTEWLPNYAVDRRKLGHGADGLPDKTSGIYTHFESIQQLNAGDVALMKGSGWDGCEDSAIVHRSPELPVGEKRLILTLDFAD
tara:strand:+ start:4270 stop:4929 length:660 start_codon:yes stop_codon:yes gene_type:complete